MKNKLILVGSIVLAVTVFFIARNRMNTSDQATEPTRVESEKLIRIHSPSLGPVNAQVTVVEFMDPECEACRAMHPIMKQLMKEYEGKMRLVIRYMPFHGNSVYAASVLEEARENGKFEAAMDILFENLPVWGSHHQPQPELIPGYLESLGLNAKSLMPSAVVPKHREKIELDRQDGHDLGVRLTPTFFVNGVMLHEIGYQPVKNAIEKALNVR